MMGQWYRRLNVQLVALMTLALLPLGSIAVYQTNRVAAEADRNVENALLGLTERAARSEQLLIERAVGAARLFGSIAPDLLDDPSTCAPILSRFVEGNPEFSFVGVLPLTGVVECSSGTEVIDYSGTTSFDADIASAAPVIDVSSVSTDSGSVFIVSEPFQISGAFAGFVRVSVPLKQVPDTDEELDALGLQSLLTFNDDGTILTARGDKAEAMRELPTGLELAGLSTTEPQTFRAENQDGVERRYSVVTIEGSPAAVMAVWTTTDSVAGRWAGRVAAMVFPVLMWFASMCVAMLAMNTLVLRHLRRLRRSMDEFANSRQARFERTGHSLTPLEIEDLENNFQRMSEEILRDEALQEDALREKGVLVKEIHHRVKNNLQLISSIMNMQIRAAEHEETRTILRRLQERVLSLATIHRDLYQSENAGRVDVGKLVVEIVQKSTEMATADGTDIVVNLDVSPVMLYPDQAVPLSLLLAEASANALKFVGHGRRDKPQIDVTLRQEGDLCQVRLTNTIGGDAPEDSTGLGSTLMNAFAMQLGGRIDTTQTDDSYTLAMDFTIQDFAPEARDF